MAGYRSVRSQCTTFAGDATAVPLAFAMSPSPWLALDSAPPPTRSTRPRKDSAGCRLFVIPAEYLTFGSADLLFAGWHRRSERELRLAPVSGFATVPENKLP